MAEGVVSFALERIEYLLIHEYNLLSGLEDSVKDLKADLQLMQSFLKDADEKQDENKLVRTCVSEIRDLAFRSENVLENFVIQVASKLERKGFRRFIRKFCECIPRHRHASEIVNIQNDITKRVERLKGFGIIQVASSSTAHQREPFQRISYPHLIEEDFVGMANDQEQLLSQLGSMDKDNAVITIKGMGGQGKTTMATRLYNHKDLRDKFSNFAWVCVTQTCQTKTIWQDILKQLRPENTDEIMRMGDTVLTEALYKIQQEKKCLVVLDDIWSIRDWHNLQPGFPVGGTTVGSKLLLTTRGLNAKVGHGHVHVHELGGLKDDEAWQLLQKKAFPGNGGNPELIILGPINKLPEPNPNHPFTSSLKKITLNDSSLKEDPMKTLEKLPNLQTLSLLFDVFVGEEMVCSTGGFSQLKTLQLYALKKIKRWEVEDGAMPNLHYLYIDDCTELEMLPSGFKFLKALKQLEIWDMPKIKERVGVEGEDFEKIQHVPSITYINESSW